MTSLPLPTGQWWPGSDCCLLHLATGLWCPLCGGTRATLALLRGDLGAALGWNPFALVVDAFLVVLLVRLVLSRTRRRRGPLSTSTEAVVLTAAAVVFLVLRNLPAFQPTLSALLGPPGLGA